MDLPSIARCGVLVHLSHVPDAVRGPKLDAVLLHALLSSIVESSLNHQTAHEGFLAKIELEPLLA